MSRRRDTVEIRVTDTGLGINPNFSPTSSIASASRMRQAPAATAGSVWGWTSQSNSSSSMAVPSTPSAKAPIARNIHREFPLPKVRSEKTARRAAAPAKSKTPNTARKLNKTRVLLVEDEQATGHAWRSYFARPAQK